MNLKKGIIFALITAIISGVSIYLNSFAIKEMRDPFIFTTLKNISVALLFSSILFGSVLGGAIKKLSKKDWFLLLVIGLVGGSIPFLLFFKGLSMGQAASVGFIHKTLFLWTTFLAVVFLKEKLGKWQFVALGLLLGGNYLLSGPKSWHFGSGEIMVFMATILWSIEMIIAKIALKNLPPLVISWGRMFFGSLFMIIFLMVTNRSVGLLDLKQTQLFWVLGTSLILFAYVGFWYQSLKMAPVSLVTSVLVLGSPITTLLSNFFGGKHYVIPIWSFLTIIFGIIIFAYVLFKREFKSETKKAFIIR